MSLSLRQQKVLAVVPKISGFTSLAFSSLTILVVFKDKDGLSKPFQRLILAMAVVDISSSFWLALSTWPIPSESGILWASGTTSSCTAQGFFTQFGISSSLYNASLSTYYLLVIRLSWSDEKIRRIELFLHLAPVLWGLGTATAAVFLEILNSANLWCWIGQTAERGENSDLFRWLFFYGPLWIMIAIVSVNLIAVFAYVHRITKSSEKYLIRGERHLHQLREETGSHVSNQTPGRFGLSNSPGNARDSLKPSSQISSIQEEPQHDATDQSTGKTSRFGRQLSLKLPGRKEEPSSDRDHSTSRHAFAERRRQVALQCFRFALAFYFTWIPITSVRIIQTANGNVPYWLLVFAAINTPFQGLPNFLVYLYPKYQKTRMSRPKAGIRKWFLASMGLVSLEGESTNENGASIDANAKLPRDSEPSA